MARVEGLEGSGDDRAADDVEPPDTLQVIIDVERRWNVSTIRHQRVTGVDDVHVRVKQRRKHEPIVAFCVGGEVDIHMK